MGSLAAAAGIWLLLAGVWMGKQMQKQVVHTQVPCWYVSANISAVVMLTCPISVCRSLYSLSLIILLR